MTSADHAEMGSTFWDSSSDIGPTGFGGLAGAAWGIAKILFWIAVVIAVTLLILGLTIYKLVT